MNEIAQQLAEDAVRCGAAGVPFNPTLPPNFDDTPNEGRPQSHQCWWHRPFIRTETVERLDAFYADRTDAHAEVGRKLWAESGRAGWMEAWRSGIRYEVRCLDGGAWDRSTSWGMFPTLDEALVRHRGAPSSPASRQAQRDANVRESMRETLAAVEAMQKARLDAPHDELAELVKELSEDDARAVLEDVRRRLGP
jgi:hypothetical protein